MRQQAATQHKTKEKEKAAAASMESMEHLVHLDLDFRESSAGGPSDGQEFGDQRGTGGQQTQLVGGDLQFTSES